MASPQAQSHARGLTGGGGRGSARPAAASAMLGLTPVPAFYNSCLTLHPLDFRGVLCPIRYPTCALLSQKRDRIGNKFRLQNLHPGTSPRRGRLSHRTPERTLITLSFGAHWGLCIFLCAEPVSHPTGRGNRTSSLRARADKQTLFLGSKTGPSVAPALSSGGAGCTSAR